MLYVQQESYKILNTSFKVRNDSFTGKKYFEERKNAISIIHPHMYALKIRWGLGVTVRCEGWCLE